MTEDELPTRNTLWRMTNGYQRYPRRSTWSPRFGIADLLKDGPSSVDELAEATGTHRNRLAF